MPLANAASLPIGVNLLLFAAAAAVIWMAGQRLTHILDAVAHRTRLGHVFVGMLLLGTITSLPELANVTTASIIGNPALAVNNLLGSAAINILLLAIADAIVGRRAVTSIVAQPSTMMMATLCMIVLAMIAAAITLDDRLVGPLGIGTLAIAVASLGFLWLAAGHDARSVWAIEGEGEADGKEIPRPKEAGRSLRALWMRVGFFGALLFASGYSLAHIGDAIAEQAGLTSAIVGFAFIGTATSLPELVTVLVALRIGRPEMAFGQVLGTNFINLSLLAVGDALYAGDPILNLLGDFEIVSALLGAILIGIFLVGLLEHRNRTIFRMGVDSAAVIVVFALGVGVLARMPCDSC
ncbi:MAG TPA: sodium:calcium antiporter [Sphingopyxis sp.]|nr:sodium:calcium antiporter [Sphingopyxis sp.]HMP45134.1 sodium:calcium antiporter [Sphingopyxis sp.]HMQ19583.1 sodium:calcium antiporter [Sphingopyxis sp.]